MTDNVATTCEVGTRDKQVVLIFNKDINYAAFIPPDAKRIGEAMAKEAYYLETGLRPEDISVIADRKRSQLINRAVRVMASMERQKKTPADIARAVVDAVLGGVL